MIYGKRQLTSFTPPSSTFCILPWVHAATRTDGAAQLCCVAGDTSDINLNTDTLGEYWNSHYLRKTRRDMLAGQDVSACTNCHLEESNGYRSHRLVENEVWKRKLGEEAIIELIGQTEPDGYLPADVQSVDLRLGNTCNLQCIMCKPRDSSKWLNLAKTLSQTLTDPVLKSEWEHKANIPIERFEWYRNETFWNDLGEFTHGLKEIIIAGGEPMLIKEHYAFIRAVCESGDASHIQLRYHTNGTIFPEEMIPYWDQFQSVEFFISLDGPPSINEYIRHPSNWDLIAYNIKRFDQLGENVTLKLLFTASALNLYYLPEFLTWVEEQNFVKRQRFGQIQQFVHPGIVHYPLSQNLKVLPIGLKTRISDRLTEYFTENYPGQSVDKYMALLTHMCSEDWPVEFKQLVEYTRGLDAARGTSFYETFPELKEYWSIYLESS